jgi:hypothetical protein
VQIAQAEGERLMRRTWGENGDEEIPASIRTPYYSTKYSTHHAIGNSNKSSLKYRHALSR